jgi:hypothetical protein
VTHISQFEKIHHTNDTSKLYLKKGREKNTSQKEYVTIPPKAGGSYCLGISLEEKRQAPSTKFKQKKNPPFDNRYVRIHIYIRKYTRKLWQERKEKKVKPPLLTTTLLSAEAQEKTMISLT